MKHQNGKFLVKFKLGVQKGELNSGITALRLRIDNLGGGFKYFLFSPLFGEDSHFD